MNFTKNSISFIKNIDSNIDIDLTSRWRHHFFDTLSVIELDSFIRKMQYDRIYLVIPMFGTTKNISKPILQLSEAFLLDNKSNPDLIIDFILKQWNISGFALRKDSNISFSLKWKRVWLSSHF